MNHQSARQNLQMAFQLAELEFGVTQILDAADMDVPEPDERCVMTYLSMIYDILPRTPTGVTYDALYENERLVRLEEYSRSAESLTKWLSRACQVMQDRSFPTAVQQLNSVRLQLARFRDEETPIRERDKQRLIRLYDDLVVSPLFFFTLQFC